MNAERGEEAQDAQRLARPRHVVIAGDDDDDRVGQLAYEPRELREGVENRGVRRPHRVKHVPRDQHEIRTQFDDAIDGACERLRHIPLPLIDAGGGGALELPEPEMQVGEMEKAHDRNLSLA